MENLNDKEIKTLGNLFGKKIKDIGWVLEKKNPENSEILKEYVTTLKSIATKLGVTIYEKPAAEAQA